MLARKSHSLRVTNMLVTRVFSSLLFLVAKYQNARERVPIKVHFQVRTFDAHAYLATAKLEFELKTNGNTT